MRMREWRQIKRTTVEKDVIENEIRISWNMFKEFFTGKIFSYRCSNTKGEKILKAEAKKDDMLVAEYQLKFKKFG